MFFRFNKYVLFIIIIIMTYTPTVLFRNALINLSPAEIKEELFRHAEHLADMLADAGACREDERKQREEL